jgi:uncharacterized peroxidase-related enzyme
LGKASSPKRHRIRNVLEQAERQVGFIPNMYARMVNSPGLLDTYLHGYDQFRKRSRFTPAEQEVIFLMISRENGCRYCVAAHSVLADQAAAVPVAVTDAIRDGTTIPDPKLRALGEFTRALVAKRGLPDEEDVDPFLAAGYTERQILEVVLAVGVKTLSNWANHLFDTPVDDMFVRRRWSPAGERAGIS